DIWIGDWDRHEDQWRWATFKSKKGDEFRPIPRDRDQAFILNEGIIPKMYGRRWALPKFEGFDDAVNWPSGLSFNARYFDRFFLTEPSEEDWINAAKDLQMRLTDDVIERSIQEWPDEIYRLDGAEVIRKLKARRDKLAEDAVEHYKFLAREVTVLGSNKSEYFEVVRLPTGDVRVKMFKASKDDDHGKKLYDRVFKKGETKAIDIYGFGGNDNIKIEGDASKSILVRIIGGEGKDFVEDKSSVNGLGRRTVFYDLKDSTSHIVSKGEVANRTSRNPTVNSYDRRAFKYDRLAPIVFANYNVDDGFFVGGGFYYQKEGFRKAPFKSRHFAVASFAPRTNSYNFLYRGDFTDVIGKWGVEINADLKVPNYVNNFFGMGNESVYDQNIDEDPQYDLKKPIDYYRFRFEEIRLEVYLTRKIGGFGLVKIGPAFQRIGIEKPEDDQDRFINDYAGTVPYDLFSEHNGYAGTSWNITVDKKNSIQSPSRGIVFSLSGRNMLGTDRKASDFSHFDGFLSLYQSFHARARVVFAARVGGGWNTGNYEFYQAQVLDGKTEIRGFRKTRFYGDRKFYTNLEMRVKLFSIRTYLFPASLGILGFHDLGRVWYKDENGVDPTAPSGKSNAWHKGWGGGVWFTPFNLAILSVEAAHTVEGTLGYIRLGYLF
ncbi:MAG TPA: BamA/TamA family outer membrane protein, partial [Chryseolinea sp.]|nr:BamA/TamA family outer membrane protein [Chryseolinea sp.]